MLRVGLPELFFRVREHAAQRSEAFTESLDVPAHLSLVERMLRPVLFALVVLVLIILIVGTVAVLQLFYLEAFFEIEADEE